MSVTRSCPDGDDILFCKMTQMTYTTVLAYCWPEDCVHVADITRLDF